MTLERDIELLQAIPFFDGIPVEPLKLIAFSADNRDVPDGGRVFKAGDHAEGGLVVIDGAVDLVDEREDPARVLERVGPGTLLGELALVIDTVRPVSARAVGRTRVLVVRRSLFRRMLGEYPAIAVTLRDRIAARLAALAPDLGRITADLERIDEG